MLTQCVINPFLCVRFKTRCWLHLDKLFVPLDISNRSWKQTISPLLFGVGHMMLEETAIFR